MLLTRNESHLLQLKMATVCRRNESSSTYVNEYSPAAMKASRGSMCGTNASFNELIDERYSSVLFFRQTPAPLETSNVADKDDDIMFFSTLTELSCSSVSVEDACT
jgi:hypothetical protein